MAHKENAVCETCSKEFDFYRSTLRGKDAHFCSRDCIEFKAWNKGLIAPNKCLGCGETIRIFRKYCSKECYYSHNDMSERLPNTSGENNPNWQGGKPKCRECSQKLSSYKNKLGLCWECTWDFLNGENHPSWKGGPDNESTRLRKSREYRIWRKAVFERDDYTCQICSLRGVYLEADHIKPFCQYPELRLDINNGRSLCKKCHLKYGWRTGR